MSGRRALIAAVSVVVLSLPAVVLMIAGCGNSSTEQVAAYNAALQAVEREKQVLANMRDERERLLGEYQMHEFESYVWSGQYVPHRSFGLKLSSSTSDDPWLLRFVYDKWPFGGLVQIDRLLAYDAHLMPWYNRFAGENYRVNVAGRYVRILKDLQDRVVVQEGRVRNAEEYARILEPK